MIITIDGPVASGKSTLGRLLAKRLGYFYIYSGLLYRALAYLLIHKKVYTKEQLRYPKTGDIEEILNPNHFAYMYDDQAQERILFDKQDITPFLKDLFIGESASIISMNVHVRTILKEKQRMIAHEYSVVVDGRDAGSVVFPEAAAKFFLTAPIEVRANRWIMQQAKLGNVLSIEEAIDFIKARDTRDETRAVAPLCIPDNAIVIDSAGLTPIEVVDKAMTYLQRVLEA